MCNEKIWLSAGLSGLLLIMACQKEVQNPHPDVVVEYTVAIDGYSVTFNNTTEGASSFKWDFGDGATSTEKSPTHTYAGKGKYVPTLYVTTANGRVTEGSTVLRISKTSPVKLKDNSFSDWDVIKDNNYTFTVPGNIARAAKFDYDATSVFFYFELQRSLADNDVFDFYLDTDGSPSGYSIGSYFTGAGVDVLLEGQIFATTGWAPDVFNYVGPGWNWAQQTINGYFERGTVREENGLLKIEGRIDRTKIKGLTGTVMKLGIVMTKNDWSAEVGYIPAKSSSAITINMAD